MAAIGLIQSIAAFPEYCFPSNGFPSLFVCKCRKHVVVVTWVDFLPPAIHRHYMAIISPALHLHRSLGVMGHPRCVQRWLLRSRATQPSRDIKPQFRACMHTSSSNMFLVVRPSPQRCPCLLTEAEGSGSPRLRGAETPETRWRVRRNPPNCRKDPTPLPWDLPPDQLSIISLLLLVDPEVTDIERRAMETSL